ncbi:MAG: DUF5655 domain-containing protein [Acidimicrobiia bacterium]
MSSRELDEYFEDRPGSREIFAILADRINALGDAEMTIGSQISFGLQRKFAWFWLYNVTTKNPNGVPHLMLALDHERKSEQVRNVSQVGKHRWNHQIVVRTTEDARSRWLGEFLSLAYRYGGG